MKPFHTATSLWTVWHVEASDAGWRLSTTATHPSFSESGPRAGSWALLIFTARLGYSSSCLRMYVYSAAELYSCGVIYAEYTCAVPCQVSRDESHIPWSREYFMYCSNLTFHSDSLVILLPLSSSSFQYLSSCGISPTSDSIQAIIFPGLSLLSLIEQLSLLLPATPSQNFLSTFSKVSFFDVDFKGFL